MRIKEKMRIMKLYCFIFCKKSMVYCIFFVFCIVMEEYVKRVISKLVGCFKFGGKFLIIVVIKRMWERWDLIKKIRSFFK